MALRTLLLIGAVVATASAFATPVRRYALDDRTVHAVRIAADAPTTVTFPGPITAIEGAGISTKTEDQPPVLISHHAESAFFSVRALRADAAAAANVIYRGRIFAFTFTVGENPDRALTFREESPEAGAPQVKRRSATTLVALLDRAKNHAALAEQYPALTQAIAHTTPGNTVAAGSLSCTVEAVFGFAAEDTVVLRLRLENRGTTAIRYAPARLTIHVAGANFPSAINDASGLLAPGFSEIIHLAVVGNPDGIRAPLSVKNLFTLSLPLPE
jgi:hypothetical protein